MSNPFLPPLLMRASSIQCAFTMAVIAVAVLAGTGSRANAQSGLAWQFENVAALHPVPGCVRGMTIAGFDHDFQGRPVVAWREENDCGGTPRVFWTRKDGGVWTTNEFLSEHRYDGGAEGDTSHQMALRPADGTPFLVYRDVGANNSLSTYRTDLGLHPNGGGSEILEYLVGPGQCAGLNYSIAFRPGETLPDWSRGLLNCNDGGDVRVNGLLVGSGYRPRPSLTVTPDGTRHLLWSVGEELFYARWPVGDAAPTVFPTPLYANINRFGGEVVLSSDANGVLHAAIRGVEGTSADWDLGAVVYIKSTDGGDTWTPFEYVDPSDAVPNSIGLNTGISLAVDANGVPMVTYWRGTDELWYARRDGPGGTWTRSLVTTEPNTAAPLSARLDMDETGKPVIALFDTATNLLRLARPVPEGVTPPIDIAVTGKVAPGVSQPGDALTYTFTVTNRGTTNVNHVVLTNALPEGASFVSASPSPGADGRWAFGTLTSGASATVTVSATAPMAAGELADAVSVTSDGPDAVPGNNSAAIGVTIRPAQCFPPTSGLVGLWRGDGNGRNSVTGQPDGALRGPVAFEAGRVGQGFRFNGIDAAVGVYPEANDNVYYPVNGSMTLQAWIRTTAATGMIAARYECMFYGCGNTFLFLYLVDGQLNVSLRDADGGTLAFAGARAVNDGAFHHVALVLDRGAAQARFYVDGAIDGSAPFTLGPISNSNGATTPLTIGANEVFSSQLSGFFNGVIDEFAIHNRVLSEAELLSIAAAPLLSECGAATVTQGLDVAVSVSSAPSPAAVGGVITYVLKATNAGTLDATDLTLTNTLPPGVTFVDAAPAPASTSVDQQTFTLESLPVGGSAFFAIRALAPNAPQTVVDQGQIFVAGDLNPSNNIASTSTVVAPDACFVAPAGLVSRWRGNGDAVDDIGGHTGDLQGTTGFALGKVGQAFSFDGSGGSLTVPIAPELKPEHFTVSAWVRPGSFHSGGWNVVLSVGESLWLGFRGNPGYPTLYTHGYSVNITAPTPVHPQQWYQLAATFDGATTRLYLNGQKVAETAAPGSLNYDSETPVGIGTRWYRGQIYPSQLFDGLIDEVTLHNRALSDAEVRGMYDGSAPSCPPPNHAPAIVNPGDQLNSENDTVSAQVTAGDSDGDAITFTALGLPPGLAIDPATGSITGHLSYQSAGAYTVTLGASDGSLTSSLGLTWTVLNTPCNPLALNDTARTAEGVAIQIPVLDNDISPSACGFAPFELHSVSTPGHGAVVFDSKLGTLTYSPAPGFNGSDTFTYTIRNGDGATSTATVTVTVEAVCNPVANPDSATTLESTPIDILAADNDISPTACGSPGLAFSAVSQPIHGAATFDNRSRALTYAPVAGFTGVDTFTYTVVNSAGGSSTATVTVTVRDLTPPAITVPADITVEALAPSGASVSFTATAADPFNHPDPPVTCLPASGSIFAVAETRVDCASTDAAGNTATAAFTVTVRDTTPPALTLSPQTVEAIGPSGAAVTFPPAAIDLVDGARPVACVPASGSTFSVGVTSVSCTSADRRGNTTTATTMVTVRDTTPPTLNLPGNLTRTSQGPGSITVTFAATASDIVDGAVPVVCAPASGSPFATGTTVVQCTATDRALNTGAGTFTVTVVNSNRPPTARDDRRRTAEDTARAINVLINDSDPDGDVLSVLSVTPATHGTVSINGPGSTNYIPDANFHGTDLFTYTITDGHGGTATASVLVTVTDVNDRPVANNDVATTVEDTGIDIAVLANDADVDGDVLSILSVTQGAHGLVTIRPGAVRYVPGQDWNGTDRFRYTIADGHGGTDQGLVTVTVAPVNDPPHLVNDVAVARGMTPVTINVIANDFDVDGPTPSVAGVTQGAHGTVSVGSSTTAIYAAAPDFYGVDTFTYSVMAGAGALATAMVTVTVTPLPPHSVELTPAAPTAPVLRVTASGGVSGAIMGLSRIAWTQEAPANPASGRIFEAVTMRLSLDATVDEAWLQDMSSLRPTKRDVTVTARDLANQTHFQVTLKDAIPAGWDRDTSGHVVSLTVQPSGIRVDTLRDSVAPAPPAGSRARALLQGEVIEIGGASGGKLLLTEVSATVGLDDPPPPRFTNSVSPLVLTLVRPVPAIVQWIQEATLPTVGSSHDLILQSQPSAGASWLPVAEYAATRITRVALFDPGTSIRDGYVVAWPSVEGQPTDMHSVTGGSVQSIPPRMALATQGVTASTGVVGSVTALSRIRMKRVHGSDISGGPHPVANDRWSAEPVTMGLGPGASVDEAWLATLAVGQATRRDITITARDSASQVNFQVTLKGVYPASWDRDAAGHVVSLTVMPQQITVQALAEAAAPVLAGARPRALLGAETIEMASAAGGAVLLSQREGVNGIDPNAPLMFDTQVSLLSLNLLKPRPAVVQWIQEALGNLGASRDFTLQRRAGASAPWVAMNSYQGNRIERIDFFDPELSLRNGYVVGWPSIEVQPATMQPLSGSSAFWLPPAETVSVGSTSLSGAVTGRVLELSRIGITWRHDEEAGNSEDPRPDPVTLLLDINATVDPGWLADMATGHPTQRDVTVVARDKKDQVHFQVTLLGAIPATWDRDTSGRIRSLTVQPQNLSVTTLADTVQPVLPATRPRILLEGEAVEMNSASGGALILRPMETQSGLNAPPGSLYRSSIGDLSLNLIQPVPSVVQWIRQALVPVEVPRNVTLQQKAGSAWAPVDDYPHSVIGRVDLFNPENSRRGGYVVAWPSIQVRRPPTP